MNKEETVKIKNYDVEQGREGPGGGTVIPELAIHEKVL
jgi:hypothetical protein